MGCHAGIENIFQCTEWYKKNYCDNENILLLFAKCFILGCLAVMC
jgi:hypothetical protein